MVKAIPEEQEDSRLVCEVTRTLKRAIAIKAASEGISIREVVEPVLKEHFKREMERLK